MIVNSEISHHEKNFFNFSSYFIRMRGWMLTKFATIVISQYI